MGEEGAERIEATSHESKAGATHNSGKRVKGTNSEAKRWKRKHGKRQEEESQRGIARREESRSDQAWIRKWERGKEEQDMSVGGTNSKKK